VVILLKIIALDNIMWRNLDLAMALRISPSEITESLERSRIAGLIDPAKREVLKNSFMEFIVYGLKYVFPAVPGPMVKGIPTAHSAPPLSSKIVGGIDAYVWADANADFKGQAIVPLYRPIPQIAVNDKDLYELLALVDSVRIGRSREVKIAINELAVRLKTQIP